LVLYRLWIALLALTGGQRRAPADPPRKATAIASSAQNGPRDHEESRSSFRHDLDQLRIQVEVMALQVDEGLQKATEVLLTGDLELAREVIAGDDAIDAMLVSLTERCYDLLCRQAPVASDLRLVVSVLRILSDLERTGDLCLRIVNLAPDQALLAANEHTFSILKEMSEEAVDLFKLAARAWASLDLDLARTLEARDHAMDAHNVRLMQGILRMDGPLAVPMAVKTLLAGRALERIADHSVMMGERLGYMMTGDIGSLSREVGPRKEAS
jgi:phosphate transport system protein